MIFIWAKFNYIRSVALIAGAFVALTAFASVFANPLAQSSQTVEITSLVVLDAKTDKVESVFPKGTKIQVRVRFTDIRNLSVYDDDDPDFEKDYVIVFEVQNDNGRTIYSTDDLLQGNKDLRLEPEEKKKITFSWNAPFGARTSRHTIIITVREAANFSNVHDEEKTTIVIQSSSASLFLSESSIDFGDVTDDDTPQARIILANPNRAAGDLIWKITELPDWLELIFPEASEEDLQESILMTNNHTIILQVRSTILKGNLHDQFKLESNAGTTDVDVSISVNRNANGVLSRMKAQSSVYDPGDEVTFLYRIMNDGEIPMTYSVTFLVQSPTGSLFFNSNAEGLDAIVGPVDKGDETDSLKFTWTIPYGTYPGDYELGAQLRAYPDFEFLFDDVPFPSVAGKSGTPDRNAEVTEGDDFEVARGAVLAVDPSDWAFGAIQEGEFDEASFEISNDGRGTLEWTVVSWPEWLELESPTETFNGEGSLEVAINKAAAPGNFSGIIEIESNGGPRSIKVSVRLIPLPTATVDVATVLALLIPTTTPAPTATSSPIPSVTPTPLPLAPSIMNGRINIRNGGVIAIEAELVAKIGDYTSSAAALDGDSYSSLVILPPNRSYIGQPIEFFLGDTRASLTTPVFFFQDGVKRLDLTFTALPTATAEPTRVATSQALPTAAAEPIRVATSKALPTATADPTRVATSKALPTNDVPPTVVASPTARPTATITALAAEPTVENVVQSATPQVFITAEAGDSQKPTAVGGCNATAGHIGWATGLANVALLIAPIGLLAGARMNRRRKRGTADEGGI